MSVLSPRHARTLRRRVRTGTRWMAVLSLVAGLLIAVALHTAARALADPEPGPGTEPPDAVAASQQAADSGKPVEVSDRTTETSQTMAQPDGTFTMTSSLIPVRVQQQGDWVPIDTRLTANQDGTLAPIASTMDVRFSGGGRAHPAIAVRQDNHTIELSWPGELPIPSVHGDTATYASVLPGVDLDLTARVDSFSEVLLVHDAAAAANPTLTNLKLAVHVDGLAVAGDGDGGISATDDAGAEILHGGTPIMWDSSANGTGPTPTATDPGFADVTPIPLSVPAADGTDTAADTTVSLHPPASELAGPGVTYPVFIDPPLLKPSRSHFAVVTTSNNWHYYDDTSNDLKVGYCSTWPECNGSWKARTYLSFDVTPLTNRDTIARVDDAQVQVDEIHSANNCTDRAVDLYGAHAFNSSTDWNDNIVTDKLSIRSAHGGNTCDSLKSESVDFSNSNLQAAFQWSADHRNPDIAFALVADDESDPYDWKRFASAGGSNYQAAQIVVKYDYPPSAPYGLAVEGAVECPGFSDYTSDPTPALDAQAIGHADGEQVDLHWDLYDWQSDTNPRYNKGIISADSGKPAKFDTGSASSSSSTPLPDGAYKFRVYATSQQDHLSSDLSGYQYFHIDQTPPGMPGIQSYSYPENTWGSVSGGTFTLDGDSDTAGFAYTLAGSGDEPTINNTDCDYTNQVVPNVSGEVPADSSGNGALTFGSGLTPGYHVLHVKAFDHAHNASREASYAFYASRRFDPDGHDGGYTTTWQAENMTFTPSGTGCTSAGHTCSTAAETGNWSAGQQQHLIASAKDSTFTTTFTTSFDADYALNFQLTQCTHCGTLQFKVDGQTYPLHTVTDHSNSDDPAAQLTDVDTCAAAPTVENVPFEGLHLTKATHTLTVTLTGTSCTGNVNGDNSYSAGLDYLRIVPINNILAGTFDKAVNNDGITSESGPAGNLYPDSHHYSLSQQQLAATGFAPRATVTVDATATDPALKTTFTMPSYDTGTNDNIIASGQTINLKSAATTQLPGAQYVDLLVASSCGDYNPTPHDVSTQFTVHVGDGETPQDSPLPRVPGLFNTNTAVSNSGDTTNARIAAVPAANTTKVRVGTTLNTTSTTHLYYIAIPTNIGTSSSTVDSITLPRLRSDFTDGGACTGPVLHVFAISSH